jgi:hypothetical protein
VVARALRQNPGLVLGPYASQAGAVTVRSVNVVPPPEWAKGLPLDAEVAIMSRYGK